MLSKLERELKKFVLDRDWDQFHSVRNLVTQLSCESAELLEHFIWSQDDKHLQDPETLKNIKEEIGDVLNCLVLIASKLNIDLPQCGLDKLKKTAKKYPVELAKGKSLKYNKLKENNKNGTPN
ncbi:MAG: nucleotide pyrophosphohydrolase [Rhabdochlamydiaceae bacterium]|nr:nucleotide pyrophosphohydrolase [Candidatus Amphrikana amoebophyrae]